MNSKDQEAVVQATGKTAGDISLALLIIVHALKQQPGFDSSDFDSRIEQALQNTDPENSLTVGLLKAALTPKV